MNHMAWWCHQLETFSASLALCAGHSPVTGEFTSQSPVARSFDVFFALRLNKRLRKQSWGWWFETPSHPLWRRCNEFSGNYRICNGFFCVVLFDYELDFGWVMLNIEPYISCMHNQMSVKSSWRIKMWTSCIIKMWTSCIIPLLCKT